MTHIDGSPGKLVTLGELMLRLSTPAHQRFVQAERFEITFGGAEANVAISAAQFGLESYFVTKLPEHELGQAAVNHLRRYGVNTEHIVRGGERLGLYFVEPGASQRPTKVLYDRANAAITSFEPEEMDWNAVFQGASWFHWTGITPALGRNARFVLERACQVARGQGVTISCDLNYRAKLWTIAEAQDVMRPLMEYVDVCIGSPGAANDCLGLSVDAKAPEDVAEALRDAFGMKAVAVTLRDGISVLQHRYSALLLDGAQCSTPYRSRQYTIEIVDRVGGGDAFAGGLITGLLTKDDTRKALEFAVAAACIKHTIPGDANLATRAEIEKLAEGDGRNQVER